ncbi:MAG TPA: hypothetical protein VGI81_25235 [Tepidisphaeraceae bacterium]|jgi:hypothetical protein
MSGLELVNDQLRSVARHIEQTDWSRHGEHLAAVEAELVEMNLHVRLVLALHEFVQDLDAAITRDIESGKAAPSAEGHKHLLTALQLFAEICPEILSAAEEFSRKGFPVSGIGRLREIAADPSAGITMAEFARAAAAIDQGDSRPPAEAAIPPDAFSAAHEAGKPFRHLD